MLRSLFISSIILNGINLVIILPICSRYVINSQFQKSKIGLTKNKSNCHLTVRFVNNTLFSSYATIHFSSKYYIKKMKLCRRYQFGTLIPITLTCFQRKSSGWMKCFKPFLWFVKFSHLYKYLEKR